MNKPKKLNPFSIEARTKSVYPKPFASQINGREKRALGDFFGIKKYGINYTTLKPGSISALIHIHTKAEEFIYILKGTATLKTPTDELDIHEGECIGFLPNDYGHQIINKTQSDVHYLEIGDRETGDEANYPMDDLVAKQNDEKKWVFTHKDGTPYN